MERFFYDFSGKILINAEDRDQAEKLVMGIDLNDYIVDEDLYEIDDDYIPVDLKKRQEQLGTEYHPLDDPNEYENYKIRECQYGNIFNAFLNGKIDRAEMLKQMDQAENKNIDNGSLFYQVQMVDLETKEGTTAKLVSVD